MKRRAIWAAVAAMAILVAVGVWFGRAWWVEARRRSQPPNILLITLDTTRADHLGCYGYHRKTTPRLDELAADAVVYDRCVATSSWTLPAHASLLTGRYPASHGAMYDPNGAQRLSSALPGNWYHYRVTGLSDRIETLATVLKRHGYATGGVVGGPWLEKPFGLAQGFDYYDDDEISDINGRLAQQINQRALPWIDKVADRPFLLFLNYFDPHDPYLPPEDFRYRFLDTSTLVRGAQATPKQLEALYDAEIYYADHFLGRLIDHLKDLGLYDDTWIIVTADHGELFGEHGLRGHGDTLYEPELHVPLIIKYPQRWARRGRSAERISLVDLMPIILERLGIPTPADVQGTASSPSPRPAFAEVYPLREVSEAASYRAFYEGNLKYIWTGSYRAFYEGNLKYIWNSRGRHMLFDLQADPNEEKNLYGVELVRASTMRATMETMIKNLPRPAQTARTKIPKETMERLRALGYFVPSAESKPTGTATSPARQ